VDSKPTKTAGAPRLLRKLGPAVGDLLTTALLKADQSSEALIAEQRARVLALRTALKGGVIGTGIEKAKQKLSEINSGSEMEMIRLQDVMQQRSSGVQLFTNLLKQLNDSQMAVIRNISG